MSYDWTNFIADWLAGRRRRDENGMRIDGPCVNHIASGDRVLYRLKIPGSSQPQWRAGDIFFYRRSGGRVLHDNSRSLIIAATGFDPADELYLRRGIRNSWHNATMISRITPDNDPCIEITKCCRDYV